ncbi:YihY/virulence factor BrkB family protein [Dietzia alimentaria]|uniref:YihY/virulence factor BrkB family protein n=1 Tax=Dietzia alimentaria TaxID=665550 RepID=UPI00031C00A2|nr:YihY/virulence factor BrkB family protein [Dietzia alimentaria]
MTSWHKIRQAVRRRSRLARMVLWRSVTEFLRDRGVDLAGSLTFYGVLSIFPALLVVLSLLGMFGQAQSTVDAVTAMLSDIAPQEVLNQMRGPIEMLFTTAAAGTALAVGTTVSMWSASRYVRALGRAMNLVFGVDEGRPVWRLWPSGLFLTASLTVLVAVGGLALVFTGSVAERVGGWIGLGETSLMVWEIAKWPTGVASAVVALGLLYRFAPNIAVVRFSWVTLGAVAALVVIAGATIGFSYFVSRFGDFNQVYGSLAGAIVFLVWLWLVNIGVVYGMRLDAEVLRMRQVLAGMPSEEVVHVTPRSTTASTASARRRARMIAEYRALRLEADPDAVTDGVDEADEADEADATGTSEGTATDTTAARR